METAPGAARSSPRLPPLQRVRRGDSRAGPLGGVRRERAGGCASATARSRWSAELLAARQRLASASILEETHLIPACDRYEGGFYLAAADSVQGAAKEAPSSSSLVATGCSMQRSRSARMMAHSSWATGLPVFSRNPCACCCRTELRCGRIRSRYPGVRPAPSTRPLVFFGRAARSAGARERCQRKCDPYREIPITSPTVAVPSSLVGTNGWRSRRESVKVRRSEPWNFHHVDERFELDYLDSSSGVWREASCPHA